MCAALLGLMLVCSTMIFSPAPAGSSQFAAQQSGAVGAAVEADVDVAVAGDFHGGDAGDRADLLHQFGGDLFGRLAQLFGELEGGGDGHLAEIALARLLDWHGQIDAVADLNVRTKGARRLDFQWNGTRETTSIAGTLLH